MNAAVTALISPLGTSLLLLLLASVARRRHRVRIGGFLRGLAVMWLLVWSTQAVSDLARACLEEPFPALPVANVPPAQAIVVLGGAVGAPVLGGSPYPHLHDSSDRVWHAARLYKAGKAPLIVLSGGSDPLVSRTSEAAAMQVLLLDLGVASSAMLLEGDSRTTGENAAFASRLLRARGIHRILLVTSAMHMWRARKLFLAEGLDVVPVATDHVQSEPLARLQAWLPDAGRLTESGRILKEALGRWVQAVPGATRSAVTTAAPS